MQIKIPNYVKQLMDELYQANYECYMVGGSVRDALLNKTSHDYDLTTNALPEEMLTVFKKYTIIPTGIKHGTVTILSKSKPVEITTYRTDAPYLDHRHPSKVIFTRNIQEDCKRRDFTINALCYNEEEGLLDFYEGRKDLEEKRIRCIGKVSERFDEDALRILRALRFSAQLNFQIEKETKAAIFAQKDLLQYISKERIHSELISLLAFPCGNLIEEYEEIFRFLLDDSFTTNKNLITALNQKGTYLSRAALLFEQLPNASHLLKTLTFTNRSQKIILSCIKGKEESIDSKRSLKKLLREYEEAIEDYLLYRFAKDASLNEKKIESFKKEIEENNECYNLSSLAINGQDVIALGYKGKDISLQLNKALEAVIEEKIENKKDKLIAFLSQ